MRAEREINITEFSDDYYTEPKKKKSKSVKVDNPWEQKNNFGQWPTQYWQPCTLNNSITIQNITFMKNKIEFISIVGYKKEDIKVQVVKDQVQITAERDIIDGYDFQKSGFDPADEKPNVEIAVTFNEETHDGKKVKVSFLNGLLRVEIPLREDITTDVEIQ